MHISIEQQTNTVYIDKTKSVGEVELIFAGGHGVESVGEWVSESR